MMAGQCIVGAARQLFNRMNAKWKARCRKGRERAEGRLKTGCEEKR